MNDKAKTNGQQNKAMKCGIIMPIAQHSDYPQDHWKDVLNILIEAINETEFEPSLVSDDPAIGLIHDRIVTNLYTNEIVICDVSSKNPNVMFELGLRLAFDKPTIIIKDELTGFSFDTGIIEHIPYPSSLRFSQIVHFKAELIKRIKATYETSKSDTNYSPFLKSFGKRIVPAKIDGQEISESKYIIESLNGLQQEFRYLRNRVLTNENEIRHGDIYDKNVSAIIRNELEEYVKMKGLLKSEKDIEMIAMEISKKYALNISRQLIARMIREYDYIDLNKK
jgi:hypothetical protein